MPYKVGYSAKSVTSAGEKKGMSPRKAMASAYMPEKDDMKYEEKMYKEGKMKGNDNFKLGPK